MSSSTNSLISDLISPLKSSMTPQLYDRVQTDLSLRESRLNSDRNVLLHKVKKLSDDNAVLDKNLRQVKADYGELLLQNSDTSREKHAVHRECAALRAEVERLTAENEESVRRNGELTESRLELKLLRASLQAAKDEVERLKADNDESVRRNREFTESRIELKQLKASSADLSTELQALRNESEVWRKKSKAAEAAEVEIRVCKKKLGSVMKELEELRAKNKALVATEAEMRAYKAEAKVVVEKVRRENEKLLESNGKLKRKYDALTDAATSRFRVFSDRVSKLEGNVDALKAAFGNPAGEQRVSITHDREPLESLGSDAKPEMLVGTKLNGSAAFEENSASSLPCQQEASTYPVKEQQKKIVTDDARPEVLLNHQSAAQTMPSNAERTASSKLVTGKYSSAVTPICISSSDDDEGEPKGLKRKLVFPDSSDHSKAPMTGLKHCDRKSSEALFMKPCSTVAHSHTDVEVESGMSKKQWEYEADMVDDLGKNTELCMKAICALYRQHITVGKSKGFSAIDAFRGMLLGKFLVPGDAEGGLKKSLVELMENDADGATKCRRMAIAHSSRPFEIYMNKEDPFFAPN